MLLLHLMGAEDRERKCGYVNRPGVRQASFVHHERLQRVNAKEDEADSSDNVLRGTRWAEMTRLVNYCKGLRWYGFRSGGAVRKIRKGPARVEDSGVDRNMEKQGVQ